MAENESPDWATWIVYAVIAWVLLGAFGLTQTDNDYMEYLNEDREYLR